MTEPEKPKLAIFDLGNVVFHVDWQPMIVLWSELTQVPADVLGSRFGVDESLEAFERGQLSPREFHRRLCARLGVELSYPDFERGWNAIYLGVADGIDVVLRRLRRELRVVAFTNTNEVHCRVWPALYRDVLASFERVFVSSEMGTRKPEPEGFLQILDHYGVEPGDALFFDDNPEFVDGARSLGIRAVLVDSPGAVRATLETLGLL
jgi:putative hydrolase of the HAD superfamily